MSTINDLPEEILGRIVELVHHSSPGTMDALAKVNGRFDRLVLYQQHHTLSFPHHYPEDYIQEDLVRIQREQMWPAIRRLNLTGSTRASHLLGDCLQKMTGLRDVEVELGQEFIEHLLGPLRAHPQIRLHMKIALAVYKSSVHKQRIIRCLPSVKGNLNLYSLDVEHGFWKHVDCSRVTRLLKGVLLTCPNLRHLRLNIFQRKTGNGPAGNQYCGFGFANGESPPALESLEIVAYPFGSGRNPAWHVGYPLEGREQEYWTNNFKWSRLKRFSSPVVNILPDDLGTMTSLKEIQLSRKAYHPHKPIETREFFARVPPVLESIKVPHMDLINLNDITKHKGGLRVLHLIWKDEFKDVWCKGIHPGMLHCILRHCPNIEELAVQLHRHDLKDALRIIARFPKLRTLTIYFGLITEDSDVYGNGRHRYRPLQYGEDVAPAFPAVTVPAVASLLQYFRNCRKYSLSKLCVVSAISPHMEPRMLRGLGSQVCQIPLRVKFQTTLARRHVASSSSPARR